MRTESIVFLQEKDNGILKAFLHALFLCTINGHASSIKVKKHARDRAHQNVKETLSLYWEFTATGDPLAGEGSPHY